MKSDTVYLHHINEATQRIALYLEDVQREGFYSNLMLQDAVVHQLQIIGEATRSLSDKFKQSHPEIAWNQIIGMRNRIVHEYFQIDLEIVWEVVQDDLPLLTKQIAVILANSTQ